MDKKFFQDLTYLLCLKHIMFALQYSHSREISFNGKFDINNLYFEVIYLNLYLQFKMLKISITLFLYSLFLPLLFKEISRRQVRIAYLLVCDNCIVSKNNTNSEDIFSYGLIVRKFLQKHTISNTKTII